MAEIPERLWLSPDRARDFAENPAAGISVEYRGHEIQYRRVRKCVWTRERKPIDGAMAHADWQPYDLLTCWTYCPYCGGEIEIKE